MPLDTALAFAQATLVALISMPATSLNKAAALNANKPLPQ